MTCPRVQVPSEVYMPDKTSHLLNLFHKEHSADVTSVRRVRRGADTNHRPDPDTFPLQVDGYWQIPRLGKTPTRDK